MLKAYGEVVLARYPKSEECLNIKWSELSAEQLTVLAVGDEVKGIVEGDTIVAIRSTKYRYAYYEKNMTMFFVFPSEILAVHKKDVQE